MPRTENERYENDFALQSVARRLPAFERQWKFARSDHPHRSYRADFCYVDFFLIVEIDGGIWMRGGGAHSHPIDIERNMKKQNDALLLGFSILRFTPHEVKSTHAIAFTQKVLFARGWRPGQYRTQPHQLSLA